MLPGDHQSFVKRESGQASVASGKFSLTVEVPGQTVEPLDAGEFGV